MDLDGLLSHSQVPPPLYHAFDVIVREYEAKKTRFVCRSLMTQIETLSRDTGYFWLWYMGNVVV